MADVLEDGFLSADEIAERTGADPVVLPRLLQVLALCGVFERDEDGRFALAADFTTLRGDHPQSMRNFCILLAETYVDAFGSLLHTVRTGESGFHEVYGVPLYEHLERDPEAGGLFDAAMAEMAVPVAMALLERYDFSAARRVVDVGGGNGSVLASLLAGHPHLEGVCVDRPSVCERADGRTSRGRLRFHPADIFEAVPSGGDLYLLKNVLHDWAPDQCLRLLAAVHRAMLRTADTREAGLPSPRLLVVEPPFEPESDAAHALFKMVLCGKDTRGLSTDDLRRLLATADFEVLSVTPLPSGHHLFECAASPVSG